MNKRKASGVVLALIGLGLCRALFSESAVDAKAPPEPSRGGASLLFMKTARRHEYLGFAFMTGSHRNGIGIEAEALAYSDASLLGRLRLFGGIPECLGVSARAVGMRYSSDFGLPGEKDVGELHLAALYSIGVPNAFFVKYPFAFGNREHTLRFGYTAYLSTDSTSQIGGQLDYAFIKGRNAFLVNYENDTMLFYLSDKYRTAAFKLSYLRDLGREAVGVSAGFNLWAGERKIDVLEIWNGGDIRLPEEAHRGNTVSLYNGREYSVDAVFLSFVYGMCSLSLGYDSEIFKRGIHNAIHYVLNDGNLPIIDRPDRFFLELRIGFPDDLF